MDKGCVLAPKPAAVPGQEKLHVTESGKGVKVRADQPHLVSLGGGRLSTAITLLPLEEGATTLGSSDDQDIVVRGTGVRAAHCSIQYNDGILILTPSDASCLVTVDGSKAEGPTILSQGCMICIGRSNYFRFNHPEQAAQLKNILPANTRVSVVPLQFTSTYLKGRQRQAIGQPSAAGPEHLLPESREEEAEKEEEAADGSDCSSGGSSAGDGIYSRSGYAGAVGEEGSDADAAVCLDDKRYRDRLAEESFSSKLRRFERLSASLPNANVCSPVIGGCSSNTNMGPPAAVATSSKVANGKGSQPQTVGYHGHIGEKVFTKHTVTTTVPLADLAGSGDISFGNSSTLGRQRSPSGSLAQAVALCAPALAGDGSARPNRRPSDPAVYPSHGSSRYEYQEAFAEDLPAEARRTNGAATGMEAKEMAVATADESLAHKHRRMVEERKLAEEAEAREQRRLEEILLLCAEYERQAESELQAADAAASAAAAVEANADFPVTHIKTKEDAADESPRESYTPAEIVKVAAASTASPSADDGRRQQQGTEVPCRSGKSGIAELTALAEAAAHDSDSGVGSSASLAGREARPGDISELTHIGRVALLNDVNSLPADAVAVVPSAAQGTAGRCSATHGPPTHGGCAPSEQGALLPQAGDLLMEDGERIYDDPASLVVPPPLPPRNSRQQEGSSVGSLRYDGHSFGSQRYEKSSSGSLQHDSSSSSSSLQRNLPAVPGAHHSTDGSIHRVPEKTAPFSDIHVQYSSAASPELREASLAEGPAPSAAISWKASPAEGSPLRRLPLASAAGHAEDEAKLQLRKLRKCQSETMHTLSALKRHIVELERQQADSVNELDAEWSALENEQKYELDQLNVQLQANAHTKAKKLASLDRVAAQHEQEMAKIETARRRLHELEVRRAFIDKELRGLPDSHKGQHMLSLYSRELEAIDNQRKLLEDLEFRQLEVESRYEEEKESVHRELSRQQSELQQTICASEERLDSIAWRQRELLRTTRGEVEDIERLRKGLVADFRKEKQRLVELEERAAELERVVDDDSSLPLFRLADGGSSSASLASLVSARDGSSGGQMWSSPSNTMDRSVLAKLKAADTLVKEDQRRLRELKLSSLKKAGVLPEPSSKKQTDVHKHSQASATAASREGGAGAFAPVLAARADSTEEGSSVKSSEATLSDGDVLSSGSNDEVDRYLELQKLLAQARAHVQNVGDNDRSLSAERKLRMDLERQLADEKEKRKQIVEEEVQLRERRRLAAMSALERPLTRYLPVRVKEFDLRQHIELAGHNVDACPFVELDSRTCRGYLLKMGSKSRSWNKRWFSFDREKKALLYYYDRNDARPRGVVYFQTIEDVFVDHMHTVKSPYHKLTFCVKTYERPYYLIAKTPETMSIWIDVIFSGAEGYLEF